MIIDFHTHIFPPAIKYNRVPYLETEPLFRALYADSRAKLADATELISNMDEQSIDVSVVQNFQWTDPQICHQSNEYIVESVRRYPGRLIGFGMICWDAPQTALAEIEYCATQGLRGIGEIRPSPALLKNLAGLKPLLQSLVDHNLVLCTHTSEPLGHLYPGKGDLTPEVLYPLITAFPELKIDCAHWGGGLPFYALMPEVSQALQNVYFDSAASPYLYRSPIYTQTAALVGAEHILFGSDFPLLKPGRLLKELDGLSLAAATRDLILGKNAQKLLGA
jgi:uncharacterized protein